MRASEFIRQLDVLYDKRDILEKKLELRTKLSNRAILGYANRILGRKVAKLIREYFREEKGGEKW